MVIDRSAAFTNNKDSDGNNSRNSDGRSSISSLESGTATTTDSTDDSSNPEPVAGGSDNRAGSDNPATPNDAPKKKEWPVRGLDKETVTEDNVKKLFKGKYEEASPEVKQLFLFGYCDCAILMMSKIPREDAGAEIRVKDYFKQCPEILSAMIRACMLKVAKGDLPDAGQKGKGGRPKDGGWEFEKDMQGPWREYTREEVKNREASEDSDAMTWYTALVAEMDTKTTDTNDEKTQDGGGGGGGDEDETGGGDDNSDCFDKIIGARAEV